MNHGWKVVLVYVTLSTPYHFTEMMYSHFSRRAKPDHQYLATRQGPSSSMKTIQNPGCIPILFLPAIMVKTGDNLLTKIIRSGSDHHLPYLALQLAISTRFAPQIYKLEDRVHHTETRCQTILHSTKDVSVVFTACLLGLQVAYPKSSKAPMCKCRTREPKTIQDVHSFRCLDHMHCQQARHVSVVFTT